MCADESFLCARMSPLPHKYYICLYRDRSPSLRKSFETNSAVVDGISSWFSFKPGKTPPVLPLALSLRPSSGRCEGAAAQLSLSVLFAAVGLRRLRSASEVAFCDLLPFVATGTCCSAAVEAELAEPRERPMSAVAPEAQAFFPPEMLRVGENHLRKIF